MSGSKRLWFSLSASFTSAGHQARGWSLTRPKAMKNLAVFSAREVKIAAAAEEGQRDEYSFAEDQ